MGIRPAIASSALEHGHAGCDAKGTVQPPSLYDRVEMTADEHDRFPGAQCGGWNDERIPGCVILSHKAGDSPQPAPHEVVGLIFEVGVGEAGAASTRGGRNAAQVTQDAEHPCYSSLRPP